MLCLTKELKQIIEEWWETEDEYDNEEELLENFDTENMPILFEYEIMDIESNNDYALPMLWSGRVRNLAKELLNIGIQTTGTIMPNRKGLPEEIRKKKIKLKKNKTKTFRKENMMSVTRTNRAEVVEEIRKPVTISYYTKNMEAVDRADHYISSYGFTRKSLNWWRKMFFWILEVAIVNSYILYSKEREQNRLRPVTCLRYRKALLKQLVGNIRNNSKDVKGRLSPSDSEERLNKKSHFMFTNEQSNSKDCAVCSDRKELKNHNLEMNQR
ncbi:hypothetical protein CBL_20378 [Carabus blaptoides fortunei]